ncbi:MAG: glycosyl hydrolase [Verrucomicrobiota bacterium]
MQKHFYLRIIIIVTGIVITSLSDLDASLSDPDATPETVIFYNNLKEISKTHLLYGQYTPYTRGKYIQNDEERMMEPRFDKTDSMALVGAHPAVVEFGLHKEIHHEYWKKLIPELHRRGVVISLSSHPRNPDLEVPHNNSHKSNEGDPVTKVLDRNSPDHKGWMRELRKYGEFIKTLKDDKGRPIPLLLRLYHEHTGGWFWWGTKTSTPEQFNELWRMTVDFYRQDMKLHNLIYVISPSKPTTREKYLSRFPGMDYVDVFGLDSYETEAGPEILLQSSRVAAQLAKENDKIAAITEFGYKKGFSKLTDAKFFTNMFLENIKKDPLASEVVYALTWFGRKPQTEEEPSNWSAYKDEPSTKHVFPDFVKFHKNPWTLFEGEVPPLYK